MSENGGFNFGFVSEAVGTALNRIVGLLGRSRKDDTAGKDERGEEFPSEHWSHFGFESRPHPESDEGRCEVIFSRDQRVTICTKDRRYSINLEDGEVALYTGKDGDVTCTQRLRPDGSVVLTGSNLDVEVKKRKGEGGDVEISAEKSINLVRAAGTSSNIEIDDQGSIKAQTHGGATLELDSRGKATVKVGAASLTLDGGRVEVQATEIALKGLTGAGLTPNQLPVATMSCMAGPFPIANGSTALRAQYP